jgi:hypothetical protein
MRHDNPARGERPTSAWQGKMGGRTFGVQSLRRCGLGPLWGAARCARLAGPEVLLSLLPLANPTL